MNFTELDEMIASNDSVIELNSDIIKETNEFNEYYDGISIDKNLTINGNNHKIDANNNGRIFDIKSNCQVNFINIIFVNGNTTKMGGAIHSNGEITFNNCTFSNNFANGNGGAVYSLSDVTVTNTVFKDNYGFREGGAVYTHKSITVYDSEFRNNYVANFPNGMGGAISSDSAYIENSRFINNTANIRGGAIISNIVNVTGSTFNFSQSGYGSAISGNTINIRSSTFYRNSGVDNGVIYGSNIHVFDSNFTNNVMTYGGAICGSNLVVNNSYFSSNLGIYGGALYFDKGSISNSIFENNLATINGGAIFAYNSVNLTNNRFIGNIALENGYGGAVYNNGILRVYNSIFINNTANLGAAIYNKHILYLNNNSITSNNSVSIENDGFINSPVTVIILNNSTINCNLGETIILDAVVKDDSGNLIKGKTVIYNVTGEIIISNENFKANFTVNSTENKLITGIYTGSNNATVLSATLNVKKPTILTGNDTSLYYGNGSYSIYLTDENGNALANETITLTINGVSYNKTTDETGKASLNIRLNAGNYTIISIFNGNEDYSASNILNNTILVVSTINSNDLVKMFRNESQFIATFFDSQGRLLSNQKVYFNINGVIYNKVTNDKGQAKLDINLRPGEYIITSYNGVTKEQKSAIIIVKSILVDNENLVKYYRNGSQYSVKALDCSGNALSNVNVTFNINGVFYTKMTNDEGIATLDINLKPGNYIVTAEFNGCTVSNDITVLQILYADDLQMVYGDGSTFDVTLLDGEGNLLADENITFNINGVFYTESTDNDGIARLNINLPPNEYIITSSYNGCNISNNITVLRG